MLLDVRPDFWQRSAPSRYTSKFLTHICRTIRTEIRFIGASGQHTKRQTQINWALCACSWFHLEISWVLSLYKLQLSNFPAKNSAAFYKNKFYVAEKGKQRLLCKSKQDTPNLTLRPAFSCSRHYYELAECRSTLQQYWLSCSTMNEPVNTSQLLHSGM
jgi:hypothetical protein